MSRKRNYKQDTIDCQSRFFATINEMVEKKVITAKYEYCKMFDIDVRHFYAQEKDNGRGYFEIAWITPLIRNFNIDSRWLLLGDE